MNKLAKVFVLIVGIGISVYTCATYFDQKEAEYEFVGKYTYVIKNDSLLNATVLSPDSYGFAIGSLTIQGLEIESTTDLDKAADYIISMNYPVKAAFIESKAISGEAMEHTSRKPLDIVQDKGRFENKIFLYRLKARGKYRLLLP